MCGINKRSYLQYALPDLGRHLQLRPLHDLEGLRAFEQVSRPRRAGNKLVLLCFFEILPLLSESKPLRLDSSEQLRKV